MAELTYRCPLHCIYCSNPVARHRASDELDDESWLRVLGEAAQLGVMQVHFTGGEPLLRRDLERLISRAAELDLYTNLITSALPLSRPRLAAIAAAGLDAIQISIQGLSDQDAEYSAGRAALADKLRAARWVRELGLPLCLNVVLHRSNIDQVEALIELAIELGAERLELANTQYLGWALLNRDALLPTEQQLERAQQVARAAGERYRGRLEILFVLPDYLAGRPRACMNGWGRDYVLVNPTGVVLPCHLAEGIDGLRFDNVRSGSLASIWSDSAAMNAFRGTSWMPEPCRGCERRDVDFGGCRCQAFQLTGDASQTDPACELSPAHELVRAARGTAAEASDLVPLRYRHFRGE